MVGNPMTGNAVGPNGWRNDGKFGNRTTDPADRQVGSVMRSMAEISRHKTWGSSKTVISLMVPEYAALTQHGYKATRNAAR
jgi:hypothetical protein